MWPMEWPFCLVHKKLDREQKEQIRGTFLFLKSQIFWSVESSLCSKSNIWRVTWKMFHVRLPSKSEQLIYFLNLECMFKIKYLMSNWKNLLSTNWADLSSFIMYQIQIFWSVETNVILTNNQLSENWENLSSFFIFIKYFH